MLSAYKFLLGKTKPITRRLKRNILANDLKLGPKSSWNRNSARPEIASRRSRCNSAFLPSSTLQSQQAELSRLRHILQHGNEHERAAIMRDMAQQQQRAIGTSS